MTVKHKKEKNKTKTYYRVQTLTSLRNKHVNIIRLQYYNLLRISIKKDTKTFTQIYIYKNVIAFNFLIARYFYY